MQRVHRLLLSVGIVPCLAMGLTVPVAARQTTVTGSVGTGYDYRERTYDNGREYNNYGDQQRIYIGPTIVLGSKGEFDELNVSYSPTINYDFVDEDSYIGHQLRFNNQRVLTSRWSLTLADDYTYSDDPEASATTSENGLSTSSGTLTDDLTEDRDRLSWDRTGSTYWTNTASLSSAYKLFENTQLSGGYSYSVLRNDEGDGNDAYNEYDKHAFFTRLAHGFNAHWRSNLGLNYTRGLYDDNDSPDLDQYGLTAGVDYVRGVQDFFPLKYSVSETQYDGDTRQDSRSQEWSIGWDHAFDQHTRLSLGGGPSTAKIQGLDEEWGYNAYLGLTKQFQHASCSLWLEKGYETNNFSGTDDAGLTDTYSAQANLTYQYNPALGIDFFGRYSQESQIDPQGYYRDAVTGIVTETGTGDNTYDKDIYETGMGLRYTFARWYTAGLRYSYYVSDGQLDSDQYTEHRVLMTLSTSRELWRW